MTGDEGIIVWHCPICRYQRRMSVLEWQALAFVPVLRCPYDEGELTRTRPPHHGPPIDPANLI